MWNFGRKKVITEEELLERYFLSGDKALLGELFQSHVRTVYGVCLYYFRHRQDAEDACMLIFEKLFAELRKTRVRSFKPWLSYVVRNFCLNELRKKKQWRFVPEHYLDFEIRETSDGEEERIARVKKEDLLESLSLLLPMLRESQASCLRMFYLEGLSYDQITAKTGFSFKEVKSHIQNGKRNLKLMIADKNDKNNAA